jgi:hypothetical protein
MIAAGKRELGTSRWQLPEKIDQFRSRGDKAWLRYCVLGHLRPASRKGP